MARRKRDTVACETCGGTGRLHRPGRLGPKCQDCGGTGVIQLISGHGVRWAREDTFGVEGGLPHGPRGVDLQDSVPVPSVRPSHLVCSIAEGFHVGSTYTLEIPQEGILLIYRGCPVDEHDCFLDKVIIRLDKALSISARVE